MGRLIKRLFRIDARRTIFGAPQFVNEPSPTHQHLSSIGNAFLSGYHTVLENSTLTRVGTILDNFPLSLRGFVYEGAAMGITLLDALTPWRRPRILELCEGIGK